jgi:hypothetical protein
LAGTAVDLATTAGGDLLVVTSQGDVLEITPLGATTVLAAPGQFARPLVACLSTGPGTAAVLDDQGSIFDVGSVPGTPQTVYSDLFLVRDPTDFARDANGTYWIACRTISNVTRAVAHVSADGQRWGYFDVSRSPLGLAQDPLTGSLLFTDSTGSLGLLTVDGDGAPVASTLTSASGFSVANLDGDAVVASDGDVYYAAGNLVRRFARGTFSTGTVASFGGIVRGVTFAPASAGNGTSLWVIEGATSTLREVLVSESAGPALVPTLAAVPGTGTQVLAYTYNVNETIVDRAGHLLVGGDSFGSNVRVDRVSLPGVTLSNVATGAMGLSSRIEGLEVEPSGRILALTRFGTVHTIVEGGPTVVGTLFSDPLDQVVVGKDLARGRDGTLYLADRRGWSFGAVSRISPAGTLSDMCLVQEARGVVVDPFGARLLANEWNNTGFNGVVGVVNDVAGTLDDLVGFTAFNMSNQENLGDGDMVVDVTGRTYVSALDEFSVVVWNPETNRKKRFATGYLNNVGGLAIARSSVGATSSTGFSLYVSQWNRLHEVPGVPPAAPRALDREAPGIGKVLNWVRPEWGRPVAMVHEPVLGALLVLTDAPAVVEMPLDGSSPNVLADSGTGLVGDVCAIAARASGDVLVGLANGDVLELDASNSYAVGTLFVDALDEVAELSDLVHDEVAGTYLLGAAPTSAGTAPLWQLAGGSLTRVAQPWNGAAMALDPLTGDPFVAQAATPKSPGELLRIHAGQVPARANHWPSTGYRAFALEGGTRGLAFDGAGNLYVASDVSGRIERIGRNTQAVSTPAGNYDLPRDLAVAPGRVGVAGAQGASLFVLDGWSVFEHGIPGPVPGATTLAIEVDPFTIPALFQFGGGNTIELASPADAGLLVLVLPGLAGQDSPFPLSAFSGDPSDTRSVPQDFDLLWLDALAGATPFAGFLNVLDGTGAPVAPITLDLPNVPAFTGLGALLDLTWVSFDPLSQSGVRTVGGTTQTRVGS